MVEVGNFPILRCKFVVHHAFLFEETIISNQWGFFQFNNYRHETIRLFAENSYFQLKLCRLCSDSNNLVRIT